jgi:hypothetical protein
VKTSPAVRKSDVTTDHVNQYTHLKVQLNLADHHFDAIFFPMLPAHKNKLKQMQWFMHHRKVFALHNDHKRTSEQANKSPEGIAVAFVTHSIQTAN